MKRALAVVVLVCVALAGCAHDLESDSPAPTYGTWGVETADMDPTVRPGDDFHRYTVGSWLATTEIPADERFTGVGLEVRDRTRDDLRAITEGAAGDTGDRVTQLVGDFHRAFMDEATLQERGVDPLRADLALVDDASDASGFAPAMAVLNRTRGTVPFVVAVDVDPTRRDRYTAILWQGGLSSNSRDYYLQMDDAEPGARAESERDDYLDHVAKVLGMAGYPDAEEQARSVLDLETKIARLQWSFGRQSDPAQTNNPMSRPEVEAMASQLRAYFHELGLPADTRFLVGMPEVTQRTARLFTTEPLSSWKAYFRYQLLSYYSRYLSRDFDEEHFAFWERDAYGVGQQRPRWERAVDLTSAELGDAVGQLYSERVFSPEKRQQAVDMLERFRDAFGARIDASQMSAETRRYARKKLAATGFKVGYPDTWLSYDGLDIRPDDLVGNLKRTAAWHWDRQVDRLGDPVDRSEWLVPPQTINGFHDPLLNDLTFPAGSLQPPFFDPAADPAANHGAAAGGAFMGHEMAHGFDDRGRRYDATGGLRDWWSAADVTYYEREADKLVAQFDAYEPLPGKHVDGRLTLAENTADVIGLRIAYDAYRESLDGRELPIIDGFTGDQRFFIAYAATFKQLVRPDRLEEMLLTDTHSPAEFRVNGVVRNIDAWYDAFDVKEGDALYLAPEDRVRIW